MRGCRCVRRILRSQPCTNRVHVSFILCPYMMGSAHECFRCGGGLRFMKSWCAMHFSTSDLILCHCTWLRGMLECAWQCGLRFTPSMCGWSSCRAQCLAVFWLRHLWQAQSSRDGLHFFVVFVVFLWCEKVLWLGGAVAWLCCVCGGVSKRSVGEGFCTQCWGRVL